jgi:hypothetical protein
MPQLSEHTTALAVNRIDDLFPSVDLRVRVHARRAVPSASGDTQLRRLGDD